MLGVGFEPTRLSPYDLKSYPLDHSGIPAFKNVLLLQLAIDTYISFIFLNQFFLYFKKNKKKNKKKIKKNKKNTKYKKN